MKQPDSTTSSRTSSQPRKSTNRQQEEFALQQALAKAGFTLDWTPYQRSPSPASPESKSSRSKSAQPHSDQAA